MLLLANGGEIRDITVRGHWKKIFEEVNNTTTPLEYTRRHSYGLMTSTEDERTVTVRTSNSANSGISIGDQLKILSINFGINAGDESSSSFRTLTRNEIRRQREQTVKFTVPPWTKFVRWQFVVDIVGNEYDHSMIWTFANDQIPTDFDVKVTVMLIKEIHFGSTRIRVKHKRTNRYLTIVERESWPAATLGFSNGYHFILNSYSNDAVTIRTLNSMYPGYDYLYAWQNNRSPGDDWVYGDKFKEFSRCKRPYWFVSKESPLYDGDVVTFKNRRFDHVYLCHKGYGYETDVHTCSNGESQWILEVV